MDFDLLILGGGLSGLVAAARAAELGVGRIGLMEKGPRMGGNGRLSQCFFSPDFANYGDYGSEENTRRLYEQILGRLQYTGNPPLLYRYLLGAREVAAWLEAKGLNRRWRFLEGPPFDTGCSKNVETDPRRVVNAAPLGSVICETMIEAIGVVDELSVYMNTPARRLLTSAAGAVCGAVVELGGSQVTVNCRHLILACGGVGGSPEALARHIPQAMEPGDLIRLNGAATNTGDGIDMAAALGAQTDRQMSMDLKAAGYLGGEASSLFPIAAAPAALAVDRLGRRVINEQHLFQARQVIERSPGKVLYALFGENSMQTVWDQLGSGVLLGDFPQVFEKHLRAGTFRVAGSLAQAADYIGCRLETLQQTLRDYDDACTQQEDRLMRKSPLYLEPLGGPPYYLLQVGRSVNSTQGGVAVDAQLWPLRPDGTVIPGLCAAGDMVSGFTSDVFSGPLGVGMTFAMASGYLAAEYAANALR